MEWGLTANDRVLDHKVWRQRLAEAQPFIKGALNAGLRPTMDFVEFVSYWRRADQLQRANLGLPATEVVKDELQLKVPIYDTTRRRYAGFSNVLEQLRYGEQSPKIKTNRLHDRDYPEFRGSELEWFWLCLVHRCTGSGASFEQDHGWRNTIVPEAAAQGSLRRMVQFVAKHPGPSCTSIGNQPPAVRKPHDLQGARNALQHYLANGGLALTMEFVRWLNRQRPAVPIKVAVDKALELNTGQKRFVFVLTAWVMDFAEYWPEKVDPQSDCYHGANARESWARFFGAGGQMTYDKGARLMADLTGTWPMDVEDVACDAVRWQENYIPKKLGIVARNSSCLRP
jgi:hypothetical protein